MYFSLLYFPIIIYLIFFYISFSYIQRTEFVCCSLQFLEDLRECYKSPSKELIKAKQLHQEDFVRKMEIEYLSKKPTVRIRLLFILEFM